MLKTCAGECEVSESLYTVGHENSVKEDGGDARCVEMGETGWVSMQMMKVVRDAGSWRWLKVGDRGLQIKGWRGRKSEFCEGVMHHILERSRLRDRNTSKNALVRDEEG